MRLQRIIEQVYHRPWMITQEGFSAIHQVIQSKIVSAGINTEDFVNPRQEVRIETSPAGIPIARIDICGVLARGLSKVERSCGNTDYLQVEQEIAEAKKQGAKAILFVFDSPGGSCSGAIECAQAVAGCELPTAAVAEMQCCSAAYMLAAGCERIFAPASAIVGSIGTIIARIDASGAWEQMGIKPDCITNDEGDLKSTGFGPSLDDAQREYLQQMVNDAFAQFRDHVSNFRTIEKWAMRGQALFAPRALDGNLIDEIGGEFEAINWLEWQVVG